MTAPSVRQRAAAAWQRARRRHGWLDHLARAASVAVVVGDIRHTRGRLVAALRVAAQGISRSLAARSPR